MTEASYRARTQHIYYFMLYSVVICLETVAPLWVSVVLDVVRQIYDTIS